MTNLVNLSALKQYGGYWGRTAPFPYAVIDSFLDRAEMYSNEMFCQFGHSSWIEYKSADQVKRTCNDWNVFPVYTYRLLTYLLSPEFCSLLGEIVGWNLFPDHGLHGGGWHIHNNQGILKPHLDYSLHPKLFMQRKLNLIIYLTPGMKPEHGGHLGLWEGNADAPTKLFCEIAPKFNRAVMFDTTKNSWHGISRPLSMPAGIWRQSLAVYYLCDPAGAVYERQKARFHGA